MYISECVKTLMDEWWMNYELSETMVVEWRNKINEQIEERMNKCIDMEWTNGGEKNILNKWIMIEWINS